MCSVASRYIATAWNKPSTINYQPSQNRTYQMMVQGQRSQCTTRKKLRNNWQVDSRVDYSTYRIIALAVTSIGGCIWCARKKMRKKGRYCFSGVGVEKGIKITENRENGIQIAMIRVRGGSRIFKKKGGGGGAQHWFFSGPPPASRVAQVPKKAAKRAPGGGGGIRNISVFRHIYVFFFF